MENPLFYIPVGGEGMRLRPLTNSMAKPSIPVEYDQYGIFTILDYSLNIAHDLGSKTIVAAHYQQESINHKIVNDKRDISFITEDRLLGIAGSMLRNIELIEEARADKVVMICGDTFVVKSVVAECITESAKNDVDVVILGTNSLDGHEVYTVDELGYYSISNQEERKSERRKRKIASLGIYVLSKKFLLERLRLSDKSKSRLDLTTDIVFSTNHEQSLIKFVQIKQDSYWADLGTIDSLYQHTRKYNILDERQNVVFPSANIDPEALVTNSILYPSSYVGEGSILDKVMVNSRTRYVKNGNERIIIAKSPSGVTVLSNF